jgi:biofilm PGA synthesis N-glycosyltransferase PgaC
MLSARDVFLRRRRPLLAEFDLRVSVLIAAFNEQEVIARTLESVLGSSYALLEVIIVNDGSTDGTADAVAALARRDSRIVLIDQTNTGKAGALNHGLKQARGDIIVTIDADTILDEHAVHNLVRHFAVDETGELGAVAGVLRVANRERNLLTRWQALEYLTQIGLERAAQDALGAISIVPGACAAWRKTAILSVGGFTHETLAEDCDMALNLRRAGWSTSQDDDGLAYTEVPETVDGLLAQRTRWTFGTLQAIYKHRDMLFRREYGWLGCYVLPSYVLSTFLPVILLPFLVFFGIETLQQEGLDLLLGYALLFLLVQVGFAAVAVALMHERWHHLLVVPIYRIAFEPLRAYLLYTCLLMALRGVRAGWNKVARTGSMDVVLVQNYERPIPLLAEERTSA